MSSGSTTGGTPLPGRKSPLKAVAPFTLSSVRLIQDLIVVRVCPTCAYSVFGAADPGVELLRVPEPA